MFLKINPHKPGDEAIEPRADPIKDVDSTKNIFD